jgi:hypothetical protein
MDSPKKVEPLEHEAPADVAVTEGFGVKDKVKEMESPKPVAESWKAEEAKPGHLPAAPDLAADDDDDEAPSDEKLAVEQLPATETPTDEKVANEEPPASETPSDEQLLVEQPPAAETPSDEQPPVIETSSDEKPPVIETASDEEPPVIETPSDEQVVVEQPPVVEIPSDEQLAVAHPLATKTLSNKQVGVEQPLAIENKNQNTNEKIDSDVAIKTREVLNSSKVTDQLKTSSVSTPECSPDKKHRSVASIGTQTQQMAGECGCVIM